MLSLSYAFVQHTYLITVMLGPAVSRHSYCHYLPLCMSLACQAVRYIAIRIGVGTIFEVGVLLSDVCYIPHTYNFHTKKLQTSDNEYYIFPKNAHLLSFTEMNNFAICTKSRQSTRDL